MRKIIIGIHGLGNKPPEDLLKIWWKKAIREGLKAIGHPRYFFKFELDVFESILDKEYRDVEGKKPTEAQVKNSIISDKRRIKKHKEYLKICEDVSVLQAVVSSLDHKKKSL